MTAARTGNIEVAGVLLEAGADLSAVDGHGSTALMAAALSSKADMVEFLIKAGSDIRTRNKQGRTVFEMAVSGKEVRPELLQSLLNKGSNLENTDTDGQTPLMRAAASGLPENVDFLLSRKASIEA